jgi:lipid II:glycine glycyltransferase (peptidoglycan interpeptide bridge formation enzyme)
MWYSFLDASLIDQVGLSFWQSARWRDILMLSRQAKQVCYWGDAVSRVLVEIRSIGLGQYGAFVLGVSTGQVREVWSDFWISLWDALRAMGVLYLQIEPVGGSADLWAFSSLYAGKIHEQEIQRPYKKFLTPHTRILDLTLTESDLMAAMHEKCRYNIRLAEKRWVTVSIVPPTSDNIDIWMWLLQDTTARDRFSGNSRSYYEAFLTVWGGELYFARYEDRVIAAGIWISTETQSIYYYGASSSADRRHMAPYLLQWIAIRVAKSKNILVYDFLGVADPTDPVDPLIGVTEFKSRFGGHLLTLPEKILIPLSWKYRPFRIMHTIKNLLKK